MVLISSVSVEVVPNSVLVGVWMRPVWRRVGDVNVAIWARRRTVSNGKRTPSSRPDARKVKKLHVDGLITGSIAK